MDREEDPDNFLDVSLLEFEGDVDEQVANLLEHVRLSRGYVVGLRDLLADLEDALRNVWPGCEVHPFGSIVSGLGIKSSDVDVFVKLKHTPCNKSNSVMLARNILRSSPWKFSNIFAIPSAKVPIVKFFHNRTGCNCDVNFKSEAGVANSKLIFHLLRTDSKALTLAIIVKYWSKVFKFTGTNLLSSYALMMLIIFYLQGINMLAPVSDLQKSVDMYMVEGWNCAFDKTYPHPRAYRDNMYHLLGGFFKYYSLFRFDQFVVSPFLGIPGMRGIFSSSRHMELHKEFIIYKEHLASGMCEPLRANTFLCIQDPFEHSRNCSMAVSQKLFDKILMHFKYAARMYDQMPPDDFLKAVFNQDRQNITRVALVPTKCVVQTLFKSKKQKKKNKTNQIDKQYVQMQKVRKY